MKKISWYYKSIIFYFKKKINIDNDTFNSDSLNELFNYYGSDKGTEVNHPYDRKGDKIIGHGFGEYYEKYFHEFKNEKFNFLEIGTWKGASLAAFKKYLIKYFANVDLPTPSGPERVIISLSEHLFDIFFAKNFNSLRL